ncbi:unnamed protein product [Bursaphelenchus xylophilus]|uniref:(pine wood nematode) hypothetical protein n=1 Tax=Bursaphelenchus xylophilus TaxID=6326 RepID=A0A1I7SS96_BURXY|nr:unnamed protein product [Bursaphelenchus xylophilus]CAG9097865.1 unnamed protein product [Bursaphelenchus xylophilus]
MSRVLLLILNVVFAHDHIHLEGETYFKSVKQLTFGGQNAEAYFSFDNKKLTYQAMGGPYGTDCDQIYQIDLDHPDTTPRRVSSGNGVCTCSYFLPDNRSFIFASTFLTANSTNKNTCPIKQCDARNPKNKEGKLHELCNKNESYFWDIIPDYDIFVANEYGTIIKQLTFHKGYDAEAVLSPDGETILYTSDFTGDLELHLMTVNGTYLEQITNELGYDGGAFFSPNGKKIVYRASRPRTEEEIQHYKDLLEYHIVEPVEMEIFVYDLETRNHTQVTNLTGANWAPYYLNDNKRIIFSSNHQSKGGSFHDFSLYIINDDGTGLERVTATGNFDAFPMQSYDGKYVVFGSTRNGSSGHEINIFLAEWNESSVSPLSVSSFLFVFLGFVTLFIVR